MNSAAQKIQLNSNGFNDVIDITRHVKEFAGKNKTADAVILIKVINPQTAIVSVDSQIDAQKVFSEFSDEFFNAKNLDKGLDKGGILSGNLKSAILGNFLLIPLIDNRLQISDRQDILLIDFAQEPRQLTIFVQKIPC